MKKTLKALSIGLALAMILAALTGCMGRKKGDGPVWTSERDVVLTLGDYNVYRDFYRYLFLNSIDYFAEKNEGKPVDVNEVKDYVLNSLETTYGMFVLADRYEITLSDEDKDNIESYIKSSKEGYTDSEFEASLAESYMDKELYKFLLEIQQLEYLVFQHIVNEYTGILKVDDAALSEAVDKEFVRASHILFTFDNAEEEKSKLDTAKTVLEKLKNGEDFETLKEEYSDDTDLKGNKDGYYFTKGEFKNEFEYTAFELEVGGLSEIVKTDVGYHIIKRLPIEEKYVNDHFEELRTQYKTALYYKMVFDEYSKFTPEYKEEYMNIQLDSFDK